MKKEMSFQLPAQPQSGRAVPAITPPREILVPVDFSRPSVAALRHAVSLARRDSAHLLLMHVIDEPVSIRTLDAPSRQRSRMQARSLHMLEMARELLLPELLARIVVCEGDPAPEITKMASQRHADLIVVGHGRHHWLTRWLHGNTALRVMETAPCPVVVVQGS